MRVWRPIQSCRSLWCRHEDAKCISKPLRSQAHQFSWNFFFLPSRLFFFLLFFFFFRSFFLLLLLFLFLQTKQSGQIVLWPETHRELRKLEWITKERGIWFPQLNPRRGHLKTPFGDGTTYSRQRKDDAIWMGFKRTGSARRKYTTGNSVLSSHIGFPRDGAGLPQS